jgi:hypothetical protein
MISFWKSKASDSEFSEFIRHASSEEKKRVYTDVIKQATEQQQKTLAQNSNKSPG